MVLIKTVVEAAKIAIKYGATGGRIVSGEAAFVSRFPPNYRPFVKDILRGFSIVTTGGIISDMLSTGNYGSIPTRNGTQTNPVNKAYSRNFKRYRRYNRRCRPYYRKRRR